MKLKLALVSLVLGYVALHLAALTLIGFPEWPSYLTTAVAVVLCWKSGALNKFVR